MRGDVRMALKGNVESRAKRMVGAIESSSSGSDGRGGAARGPLRKLRKKKKKNPVVAVGAASAGASAPPAKPRPAFMIDAMDKSTPLFTSGGLRPVAPAAKKGRNIFARSGTWSSGASLVSSGGGSAPDASDAAAVAAARKIVGVGETDEAAKRSVPDAAAIAEAIRSGGPKAGLGIRDNTLKVVGGGGGGGGGRRSISGSAAAVGTPNGGGGGGERRLSASVNLLDINVAAHGGAAAGGGGGDLGPIRLDRSAPVVMKTIVMDDSSTESA